MAAGVQIEKVTGPAITVRGHDVDTDRIIPARFLKAITFDGLEAHVFADDRRELDGRPERHPFDDPDRAGARVLLVNDNFGCGSSREHAPQAIQRWGIRALVGQSFAEIFFANALTLGLPCLKVSEEDIAALMAATDATPATDVAVDIAAGTVRAGSIEVRATMPDEARKALLSGDWDATANLLDRYADVEQFAATLPYLSGFRST